MWWNYENFPCLHFSPLLFSMWPWSSVLLELPQQNIDWVSQTAESYFLIVLGPGCPRSSVGRVGFWWKCSLDLYLALISLHPHLNARFLLYVERQWSLASSSSKGWALIFHLLDMTTPVPYSLHSSLGLWPLMEVLLLPDPTDTPQFAYCSP